KLRTALTMLGMIFGVGAVIAMLSIGAGAEQKALEAIGRLGLRNVIVRAKEVKAEERAELRKKSLGVSLRDAEAIVEAVPNVERVLPRVEVKPYKIMAPGAKAKGKVFGISWRYRDVADVGLTGGRFFDARDERDHAQVCVIGQEIRRSLFGYGPVLGKRLKVNDVWLEVVGVLANDPTPAAAAQGPPASGATSKEIWIPVTTAMRKFDRDPLDSPVDELLVTVKEGVSTRDTAQIIEPLIQRLHGSADDYEVVVPEALLEQSRQTQRIFNIVMGSIAGISMLVGGIGIMNIMLASVLERTRDIGIALAGFVAAFAGWPTVVSAWSIVLATGVSASVGWLSGVYPATRAAKL